MTNVTTLDAARVQTIANEIRNACAPIVDADLSTKEARDLAKNLQEQGLGVRETLMSRVATLSSAGAWDAREIEAASKAAAAMGNDQTDKSMATFIGQVKLAAMPLVRDRFADITTVVNDAWQAEGEQLALDAGSPAPLRKAWKRRFHTLVHVCKVIAKAERDITSKTELVSYAYECDPDHDADKVAKRIETLIKQVNAIYTDFPADDLKTVADYLATISPKTLQDARAKMMAEMGGNRPLKAATKQPAKPAPKATEPVVTAPAVVGDAEIDDLLGDNVATLSQAA